VGEEQERNGTQKWNRGRVRFHDLVESENGCDLEKKVE